MTKLQRYVNRRVYAQMRFVSAHRNGVTSCAVARQFGNFVSPSGCFYVVRRHAETESAHVYSDNIAESAHVYSDNIAESAHVYSDNIAARSGCNIMPKQ